MKVNSPLLKPEVKLHFRNEPKAVFERAWDIFTTREKNDRKRIQPIDLIEAIDEVDKIIEALYYDPESPFYDGK